MMFAATAKLRQLGRKALRRSMPRVPWRVRPVILMYHCIDDDSFDPWGLSVSPKTFAAQMNWLARNRIVLPLADFAEMHRKRSLPSEAVALTFDDGYASVAEMAAPILERLQLPATIFVPAEMIERRHEFWWDQLAQLIIGFEGERLSILGKDFHLGRPQPNELNWRPYEAPVTRRQQLFRETWAAIRTRPIEEIDRALHEIAGAAGSVSSRPSKALMTPRQVKSVNTATVKIGSHALTHSSLPTLSSEQKRREICGSIDRCKALTGEPPRTFAYPFGDYDDEARSLVEECGFACGCTTEGRPVSSHAPSSRLPRIGVGNWDPELMKRVLVEL